jgi:DNA invertase Pin-like site-specific DNA recombinase
MYQQHRTTLDPSGSRLDTITASLVARQSRTEDGSLSVADQIEAMRGWCERQTPPVAVGAIHEERDVSGRRPLEKRKGLSRAVADVEEGRSQMILTAYFDRLVRSVATRAEAVQRVERAGGAVMTMDMGRTSNATAAAKLSGTLLAAIAEFYADQIGEKMVPSIQRNIDSGVPPYPRITAAFDRLKDGPDKGKLRPSQWAPLIAEAARMRAADPPASYQAIQRYLLGHGLRLSVTAIQSTLASRLLIGEIHFGDFRPNLAAYKQWGCEEPLVDRATFRKIQSAKATRGRYVKSEQLLARLGVLLCDSCGTRMTVHSSTSRGNGKRYAYYQCGNTLCPARAIVSAEVAEKTVSDEAIRLAGDAEGRADALGGLEQARLEREAAEAKLTRAIVTLAGLGDEAATREVLDELQAARDAAVAEHERLLARTSPAKTVTAAGWKDFSLEGKREVIRAVVAEARVAPGRGPDRITIFSR